ncbi:hypothetical protein D7V97_25805 [Corallococcus sp. CA053C]|nr:hypothetical protein D7V97_25805 [Corallococcus sp. CA053C]
MVYTPAPLLKRAHTLIFPTHALFWLGMGLVFLYGVAAILLAPTSVHLLPRFVVEGLLQSVYGYFFLLLGIPCGIYVIGWRASDVFVWTRAPGTLAVDDQGLRDGTTRIAWRNVHTLVEQHQEQQVVLHHRDGTYRLRLGLWSDADDLRHTVLGNVVPRLLEGVGRQVAAGEPVRFGPLTLSDAGLTHKGQLMRWEDIESIRLQDELDQGAATRELIIVSLGKPRKIDEAKVINAPVLLAYLSDRLAG